MMTQILFIAKSKTLMLSQLKLNDVNIQYVHAISIWW